MPSQILAAPEIFAKIRAMAGNWTLPPDTKCARILLALYCVVITVFCFHFLQLAKTGSLADDYAAKPRSQNVSVYVPEFPRKIWQTGRTSAVGLENKDRIVIQSWLKLNQKHRYEVITQHSAESYVRERFGHRRDIEETFTDLQDPILRADLIRYLVLLGDGGVYSDIDTKALKPIEDWVPSAFKKHANVVIGVEYDKLGGARWIDWTLDLQFCTWVMLAKPGHPLMQTTVERVIARIRRLAQKQGTTVSGIKTSFHDVLDTTGPGLFTEAVFEGLSYSTGTNFTWHNVTGLLTPKLVGDILILPINAFGSGQAHSNSGSPEEDTALVEHLFRGSWKSDHPFETKKADTSINQDDKPGDELFV